MFFFFECHTLRVEINSDNMEVASKALVAIDLIAVHSLSIALHTAPFLLLLVPLFARCIFCSRKAFYATETETPFLRGVCMCVYTFGCLAYACPSTRANFLSFDNRICTMAMVMSIMMPPSFLESIKQCH